MPTERMEEVEVVVNCQHCCGVGTVCYTWSKGPAPDTCIQCDGTGKRTAFREIPKGSLTSARLRLADAAEAWAAKWLAPVACRDADEWDAMLDAAVKLAALRTARGEG